LTTALSARNAKVQRLRRLAAQRRARAEEGAFVIEGWKLVDEALQTGFAVEAVFVAASAVDRLSPGNVPVHVVDERALAGALDTATPQGVAAIARIPSAASDEFQVGQGPVLVLVGVGDPGNAGTLLRAAEAAGCRAVLFVDGSVDAYSPKCVRASAGSIFRVPLVNEGEGVSVLDRLGDQGVRRLGTSAHDGTPYDETDLVPPFALVVGNEAHGLPVTLTASLDGHVHIPMQQPVESLNVGVAGSIILFEAARQRREAQR
jgi:TrmH family RNA methyltransferase